MIPRRILVVSLASLASLGPIALALVAARPAHASTVTIGTSKDNTLFEVPSDTSATSNGAGGDMFCGMTNTLVTRRMVVAFNVAAAVPAGATIDSVNLTMHLSRRANIGGGPLPIELRALLANWGEGASDAGDPGGGGVPASAGDATWFHTFHNTNFWTTPGGDFSATVSATKTVNAPNFYTWESTPQLKADVQSWLNSPATNFGWLALGDESLVGFAKQFDTKEDTLAAFRPALTIHYTHPLTSVGGATSVTDAVRLEPNSPNPFARSTTFAYSLAQPGRAVLTIHDATGRVLAKLVDRAETAGSHAVVWDGRDSRGARVAAGVYFSRLESGGAVRSREIVLSR